MKESKKKRKKNQINYDKVVYSKDNQLVFRYASTIDEWSGSSEF